MNSLARPPSEAWLSSSAANSLAIVSWLPRHRAALSRPASCQARAPSVTRLRVRRSSRPASIQDRSRGQAVSRASWVICAASASTVISRSPTNRPSTVPGFVAPGLQFAEPDRGAGGRRVVGDVHEPEEQAARQPLLRRGEAVVRGLGGPGERVPDPAAGQVVGDGEHATAAVLPGGEQGVRQQRQRAWLVGGLRPRRVGRGQVVQQQPDQALLRRRGEPAGQAR